MKSKMVNEHILTVSTGVGCPDGPPGCETLRYITIRCRIKTIKDENIITDSGSEFPSNPSNPSS